MFEALKEEINTLGGIDYLDGIPDAYLTPRKLENLRDALIEEVNGATVLKTRPFEYVLEPTNHCNLACTLCPTGQDDNRVPKGRMPTADFFAVIDRIADTCGRLFIQNWGEPTLLRDLPDMIRYAADRGIWVILSSNFSIRYRTEYLDALVRSGLGVLHIDIDGTTQEVYERYRRNGNLALVIENTRAVVATKQAQQVDLPRIDAAFIVNVHNEHQLDDFKRLCADLGVDRMEVSKLQVNPASTLHWLPKNSDLRYNNYLTESPRPSSCQRLYVTMTINWNGTVDACCIVYDPAAKFADLSEGEIDDIWNNEFFRSARAVFHDRESMTRHTICEVCENRLGAKISRYGDSFAITL